MGQIVADVPSGLSLTPPHETKSQTPSYLHSHCCDNLKHNNLEVSFIKIATLYRYILV
jgi:hypothetical protein